MAKSFLPQTAARWVKQNVREKSPDQARAGWRNDPDVRGTMAELEHSGAGGRHAEGIGGGLFPLDGVLKLAAESAPADGTPGLVLEDWRAQVGGVLDGTAPGLGGSAVVLRDAAGLAECGDEGHCRSNINLHVETIREAGRDAATTVQGAIGAHAKKVLASPEGSDLVFALVGELGGRAIKALTPGPLGKPLAGAASRSLNATIAEGQAAVRGLAPEKAVAAFFDTYRKGWTAGIWDMGMLAQESPMQSEPELRLMAQDSGALETDLIGGIWSAFLSVAAALPETTRFDGMPQGGYRMIAEFDYFGAGVTGVRIPAAVAEEHREAVASQPDLWSTQGWLISDPGFLARVEPDGSVHVFHTEPGFAHEVLSQSIGDFTEAERLQELSDRVAERWDEIVRSFQGVPLSSTGLVRE